MDTDESLVSQLMLWGFVGTSVPSELAQHIRAHGLGGVVLFARNIVNAAGLQMLTADLRALSAPDQPLVAIDQEGGSVTRIRDGATVWPSQMALGAAGDPCLTEAAAAASAAELRALGVTVNLAPVADVLADVRNPAIGTRAFGDDPDEVSRHVAASIRGLTRGGVAATAKHFPGHGATPLDSHIDLPKVERGVDELAALDLPPFCAAVAAGVPCVMTSHVSYSGLDAEPVPATLSPHAAGLLRRELGFEGIIMTDCLGMEAIQKRMSTGEAAVQALRAGADMIAISQGDDRQREALAAVLSALRSGRLSRERLEDSCRRIRRLKRRLSDLLPGAPTSDRAEEIGRRSVTLIRDRQRTLPLLPHANVAVVTFCRRTLTEAESPTAARVTLADAVRCFVPSAPTVELGTEGDVFGDNAEETIARADAVVVASAYAQFRPLVAAQVRRILALGRPTAVVAIGDPFDICAFPEVPYYLATYGDVPSSLRAAASILFGEAHPGGRLPVAIPNMYPRGFGLQGPPHGRWLSKR